MKAAAGRARRWWVRAAILPLLPAAVGLLLAQDPGDLDGDGDVDKDDLQMVLDGITMQLAPMGDPRDLDGNGRIEILDAGKVVLLCTRPLCQTEEELPDPPPPKAGKVFVTSTIHDGDLRDDEGACPMTDLERENTDPLDRADRICNCLAGQAGLKGRFAAWLSTAFEDARDRIDDGPWETTCDPPLRVADDIDDLTDGNIQNDINCNQRGQALFTLVWTGTGQDGRAGPGHCASWTSGSAPVDTPRGRFGSTQRKDAAWTQFGSQSCFRQSNFSLRFYCFQNQTDLDGRRRMVVK